MKTHKLEIKLDYDTKELPLVSLVDRVVFIEGVFRINLSPYDVKICRTAKGWHIYLTFITLHKYPQWLIVVFQTALLSDYKRELFNAKRVFGNAKKWNVLFEEKRDNSLKIISRETRDRITECEFKGIYGVLKLVRCFV